MTPPAVRPGADLSGGGRDSSADRRPARGPRVVHGKADLTRYGLPYQPPGPHSAAFFAKHGRVIALLPVGDDFIEIVAPTRSRRKSISARRCSVLRLERVDSFYGESQALHAVSLVVGEDKRVALVGRNGAGKSTLMKSKMNVRPRVRGKRRSIRWLGDLDSNQD